MSEGKRRVVVALDVGTTKVCTLIALNHSELDSERGGLEILGIGQYPSYGLKKGHVIDIEKTMHSIRCSLEEAQLMSGETIREVQLGIAGSHIYSFNSSGVVAIAGSEVEQGDIDRVLDATKAVIIPKDREILQVISRDYVVDNIKGINNPIGMNGTRLECHSHIVTGTISKIRNLVKCVEKGNVKVSDIILQPYASSEAVLSEEEKQLGVVLVDIGGGTTDLAIWKNGGLVHTQIIPVGGNHFTNDLAMALQLNQTQAERIKSEQGDISFHQEEKFITVEDPLSNRKKEISTKLIEKVLRARSEELLITIYKILKERENDQYLSGGVVITGGGALLRGLIEYASFVLSRPVKLGLPNVALENSTILKGPHYSTVLGLLLMGLDKPGNEWISEKQDFRHSSEGVLDKFKDALKGIFREIF